MIWIDSFWCIMIWIDSFWCIMIFKKAPHQWCIDSCVPASMMHRFFPSASMMHRLSNPKSTMHRLSKPISTMHRLSPARIIDASIISPPHHWCIDNCDYFWCIDASINFNNRCGPLNLTVFGDSQITIWESWSRAVRELFASNWIKGPFSQFLVSSL